MQAADNLFVKSQTMPLSKNKEGLTYEGARGLLASRKVTLSRGNATLEWDKTYSEATFGWALLSSLIGCIAFFNVSSSQGTILHKNDTFNNESRVTHYEDVWQPNTRLGCVAAVIIMLTLPLIVPAFWKLSNKYREMKDQRTRQQAIKNNEDIESAKAILLAQSKKFGRAAIDRSISEEDISLMKPFLKIEDYQLLNFTQQYTLQHKDPHFIKEIRDKGLLTEKQKALWTQLETLTSLDAETLAQALTNPFHLRAFRKEPQLLLALIHRLPGAILSDTTINAALADCLKAIASRELAFKDSAWQELVSVIHEKGCTLQRGLFYLESKRGGYEPDLIIQCQDQKSVKINSDLFCQQSTVFRSMLKGPYKERGHNQISLLEDSAEMVIAFAAFTEKGKVPPMDSWQELLALAIFAQRYDCKALLSEVESSLFGKVQKLSTSELSELLEYACEYHLLENLSEYLDQLCVYSRYQAECLPLAFSESFAIELNFVLTHGLKDSLELLLKHLKDQLQQIILAPTEQHKSELLDQLLRFAEKADCLKLVWPELRPVFDAEPQLILALWQRLVNPQSRLARYIKQFCADPANYEICLACWGTSPTLRK